MAGRGVSAQEGQLGVELVQRALRHGPGHVGERHREALAGGVGFGRAAGPGESDGLEDGQSGIAGSGRSRPGDEVERASRVVPVEPDLHRHPERGRGVEALLSQPECGLFGERPCQP